MAGERSLPREVQPPAREQGYGGCPEEEGADRGQELKTAEDSSRRSQGRKRKGYNATGRGDERCQADYGSRASEEARWRRGDRCRLLGF